MAANAAGGAVPPGTPGFGEQGGQPAASQAQKGTLEYAIIKLSEMAKTGNYDGVEELISERAKGLAASIRKGELTEEKIESYKSSFEGLELYSTKASGNGRQFILKNRDGKLLQFLVVKEGDDFVIRDFSMRDAKK